jgi:hypothetical protein
MAHQASIHDTPQGMLASMRTPETRDTSS